MNKISKAVHYFYNVNPYKSLESVKNFVKNECIYHMDEIAAFNRPPGFSLLGSENAERLKIVRDELKTRFNWQKSYQYYLTPNDLSGIMLFTASPKKRQELAKLMHVTFTSKNIPFLKYYAITSFIPLERQGAEVFHSKLQNLDKTDLFVEQKVVSRRKMKLGEVRTHHIGHQVVDYNMDLNVALLELYATFNDNDGLQLYCMKKLAPCLGDHKYSAFIRQIANKPFLIDAINYKSQPQILNKNVLEALGINSYMTSSIPLHLHLHGIDLPKKFKGQKISMSIRAPVLPYFTETLNRLGLKFDRKIELNKE